MVVTSLSDRRTADDGETTPTLTAGSTVKVVPSRRGAGNRLSAATLKATFGGSVHDALFFGAIGIGAYVPVPVRVRPRNR